MESADVTFTLNGDPSTFVEVPQDAADYTHSAQLTAVNAQLDAILRLVRDHPETAQFVQGHLHQYLTNMQNRLKKS